VLSTLWTTGSRWRVALCKILPENTIVPFRLFFLQKNGHHRLEYGSRLLNYQSTVSDNVRSKLMLRLDVESQFTSDWRDLAERLGATNEDIRFLESRKNYHESPTQHIINVVEMMKMPLSTLKDIFIHLGRDDIVRMLNLEIGSWCARRPLVIHVGFSTANRRFAKLSSTIRWKYCKCNPAPFASAQKDLAESLRGYEVPT